ncbi:MBL fold metallo-hydrolase [Chloroflexota bacterium]
MQQISENVYVETRYDGANVSFVTTNEGVVMIDTPSRPSHALQWRDEIAKRGEVCYLINTEHHRDHFTGNYFFTGTVVSHEETCKEIRKFSLESVMERIQVTTDITPFMENYQVRPPTVTFSERLNLYLGNHSFTLTHIPGHTAGQTAVYVPEEKVLFTGDAIFYNVQVWIHEGNPFHWLESLKKIETMDVDVIVPGHGELCDKNFLPEISSFIKEWIDAVRDAIDQGLSKEEAMNKISFVERYPMHQVTVSGTDLQRWNVARIYDLMTS